ncbi:outer membrane protein assembly factor BamB [Paucibacter soli]|uniref:outer membrane protein assembly factor BamB n=1 Tax=Paucibacter soli TaxID=3133433 RepID=UPI0030AD4D4D
MMMSFRRGAPALLSLALLAGCSIFGSSNAPKPAALETITPQIAGRQVWHSSVGSVQFPLAITARNEQFFVAGSDGAVMALQAGNGQLLWRAEVGERLSAGVGSDGRFAAVVTRGNEVVLLDAGKVLWRKALKTPVTTAPLVAGERVFVLTVDRVVHAFDALDGRRLWELRRPGDALTLAQAGVITSYKDTLVVGQGARMAGVDPLKGTLQWEASVANPRGTNEVERLADLVAPALRTGELICARAFQSAVACINADRGTTLWSRNVGGGQGVGGDAQLVVAADGSDRITAWNTRNGDVQWTAEQFLNRKLSAPLVQGPTIVFGDFEGQLHFISRDTGKTQLRLPTDGSPIVGAPVLAGNTLLVATRNGGLFAFRPE